MLNQILLFCVLVLVVLDCVLCSDVVLQLVCVLLVAVICGGAYYIARKNKNGVWLSKQQYEALHEFVGKEILKDRY